MKNKKNLLESEYLYKTIFESNIAGIAITDMNGNFYTCNSALEEALGYKKKEFSKINTKDLYADKNDRIKLISLLKVKGSVHNFETRLIRKDGTLYWINLNCSVIKNDEGEFLLSSIVDISEKKYIEQELIKKIKEYRQLFDLSPIGIAVYDILGNYMYVNPAYCRIFKREQKELIGMNYIYTIVPRENQGKEIETFVRALKSKSGIKPYDAENIRGDGKKIAVHYMGDYTRDINGEITGIVIFCEDITENLQIKTQLHKSEKLQALGKMAGGIAHDFNNLLAIISGYSEILKSEMKNDSELSKFVDIIIECTDSASELTGKMLAFGRKGRIESVPVDIRNMLEDVMELLNHSLNKNVLLRKQFSDEKLVTTGDPSQLQNVFLNLAFNSQDAMENGGRIFFKTRSVHLEKEFCNKHKIEPGNYIEISIRDSGSGIDKEILEHIYEPFFTTKEFGMGMGLSAVYGIIKNHKGAIIADSEIKKGSEFLVYLPVSKLENKVKKRTIKYNKKDLQGSHILVIDDEKFVCNMLNHILSKEDYKVTVFMDSFKAVKEYKKIYRNIDLVIIDMIMPGLNGKDVFLNMKKINPDVKAILSSGYSMEDEYQQIQDIGIKNIIHKPFKQTELLDIVAETLLSVS